VSSITNAYPIVFPFHPFLGANVADPPDSGYMKIIAVPGRGTKCDFVDLYVLARDYRLEQLLEWINRNLSLKNYNTLHVTSSPKTGPSEERRNPAKLAV
jgi:hypothetical protein